MEERSNRPPKSFVAEEPLLTFFGAATTVSIDMHANVHTHPDTHVHTHPHTHRDTHAHALSIDMHALSIDMHANVLLFLDVMIFLSVYSRNCNGKRLSNTCPKHTLHSMIHDLPGELERVKYAIPFMTHANGINHVFDVVAGHHPAHAKGQTALHCASRAGHSKIVREVCRHRVAFSLAVTTNQSSICALATNHV